MNTANAYWLIALIVLGVGLVTGLMYLVMEDVSDKRNLVLTVNRQRKEIEDQSVSDGTARPATGSVPAALRTSGNSPRRHAAKRKAGNAARRARREARRAERLGTL